MEQLPQDPVMLYSVINTKLRDFYPSLQALCEDMGLDGDELKKKLSSVGFEYNTETNQFIQLNSGFAAGKETPTEKMAKTDKKRKTTIQKMDKQSRTQKMLDRIFAAPIVHFLYCSFSLFCSLNQTFQWAMF